ncbi:hypothetical protein TWF173_000895 [Orbilia oligospora]|nr:hypothetical protein TWF173_000895 [Orbilia oligospora]
MLRERELIFFLTRKLDHLWQRVAQYEAKIEGWEERRRKKAWSLFLGRKRAGGQMFPTRLEDHTRKELNAHKVGRITKHIADAEETHKDLIRSQAAVYWWEKIEEEMLKQKKDLEEIMGRGRAARESAKEREEEERKAAKEETRKAAEKENLRRRREEEERKQREQEENERMRKDEKRGREQEEQERKRREEEERERRKREEEREERRRRHAEAAERRRRVEEEVARRRKENEDTERQKAEEEGARRVEAEAIRLTKRRQNERMMSVATKDGGIQSQLRKNNVKSATRQEGYSFMNALVASSGPAVDAEIALLNRSG